MDSKWQLSGQGKAPRWVSTREPAAIFVRVTPIATIAGLDLHISAAFEAPAG